MTSEKESKRRLCEYLIKKRIIGPVTGLFIPLLVRSYLSGEAYA